MRELIPSTMNVGFTGDEVTEKLYLSLSKSFYGLWPRQRSLWVWQQGCMRRLDNVVGERIRKGGQRGTRVTLIVPMNVEWGGSWGMRLYTHRNAVLRAVRKYIEQHPQVMLVCMTYDYQEVPGRHMPKYKPVLRAHVTFQFK